MTMPSQPAQPDDKYFLIVQKAAGFITHAVEGNGVKPEQVVVNLHDTKVYRIAGAVTAELVPKIVQSQLKGNMPHGLVLGSKLDVTGHIEGLQPEFLKSETVRQSIAGLIEKSPGHGWGIKPVKIHLPETRREFSVIDKCLKCGGTTRVNCIGCNATGTTPCQNCHGHGLIACLNCRGAGQVVQSDGAQMQCMICGGQGRVLCQLCKNTRNTPCAICAGNGMTGCIECGLSGFWTNVYSVTYDADIRFTINRELAEPHVLETVDKLQAEGLGIKGHADIFHEQAVVEGKRIVIPLTAVLPIATAEFSVGGKNHPAIVAGLNARIVEIEPFMDILVKPGINALFKLSKGGAEPNVLIATACRYEILRRILSGLAELPAGKVYQGIAKDYPAILSEKYAKAAIKYASQSILALGGKLRTQGLIIGALLSFVIFLFYYAGPFKQGATGLLAQKHFERGILAVDAAVWALCYLITLYTIKLMAAKALRRFLPDIVKTAGVRLPAAGSQGLYAVAATLLALLAAHAVSSVPIAAMLRGH